jgi:hypothetical protein
MQNAQEKPQSNDVATELRARIVALETWKIERTVESARHDERWKHLDVRFNQLDKDIKAVSTILSRLNWLVISGIVVAAIAFVIGGGFAKI